LSTVNERGNAPSGRNTAIPAAKRERATILEVEGGEKKMERFEDACTAMTRMNGG